MRRLAFRSMLYAGLPAYIVMRAGAEWMYSKEFPRRRQRPGLDRHRLRRLRPRPAAVHSRARARRDGRRRDKPGVRGRPDTSCACCSSVSSSPSGRWAPSRAKASAGIRSRCARARGALLSSRNITSDPREGRWPSGRTSWYSPIAPSTPDPLLAALEARARSGPIVVTLLVPAAPGERPAARERMDEAIARLAAAGIEAGGLIGPPEPLTAVSEEYDNARYDEVDRVDACRRRLALACAGAARGACSG